jgi:hypothetical protein
MYPINHGGSSWRTACWWKAEKAGNSGVLVKASFCGYTDKGFDTTIPVLVYFEYGASARATAAASMEAQELQSKEFSLTMECSSSDETAVQEVADAGNEVVAAYVEQIDGPASANFQAEPADGRGFRCIGGFANGSTGSATVKVRVLFAP